MTLKDDSVKLMNMLLIFLAEITLRDKNVFLG
jgi:hypothetical protein